MKKISIIAIVAVTVLSFAFKQTTQGTWAVDKAHAKLGFTIRHMAVSDVEGWFKNFDAKITSSKDDFSDAVVELTADVNSINTDNDKRDTHLKSPDFFDATKYPSLSFTSKTFKKVSDKNYKITGDLTLHGITKPVELDAVCNIGTHPMSKKTIAGFKVTGTIKRSDFGIGGSMPTTMLGEEVSIIANTEFVKN